MPFFNGWFRGSPISGNLHIQILGWTQEPAMLMFTGQAEPTQWSLVKPLPEWLLEGRRASECQSTPHAGVSFANSCEANILWRLWWYIMVKHGWFVALWFVSLHNYTQKPILATSYAHFNPVSFLTVTCRECRARHFLQEVALYIYI